MGGPDAEYEVSLMSGRAIAEALRATNRYTVIEEIVDRPGFDVLKTLLDSCHVDVVFPALHGKWGEGGELQELLEEIGVSYVGSKPRPAKLAMNKFATKALLDAEFIPTPTAQQLHPDDECDLEPPIVLKPIDEGSSVDLRICRSVEEIENARAELHPRRTRLLAERYIAGRELTVGVVCTDALPLIEIIPSVEYYDYEAKYIREDTQYIVNPDVPEGVARACEEYALRICRVLGIRDIARVDFMLDDDGPWVLEVNTMPGFTTHSLVPMAAEAAGMEMPDLCALLVDTAYARSPQAPHEAPSQLP